MNLKGKVPAFPEGHGEPNEARSWDGAVGIMGWREEKEGGRASAFALRLERSGGVRRSDTESLLMMSPE